ncbi:MAG: DinB family protein [Bacteroidetes bacterium]|nr:DinB family protein [Bacteroidota bacterium]
MLSTHLLTTVINQLQKLLFTLTNQQYQELIPVLSNASFGQHTRHIIEFFIELNRGYETGRVNYDARKRDPEIETNVGCAIRKLQIIKEGLDKKNKALLLDCDFGWGDVSLHTIPTSFERELVYNLEHTIHHMAIIRIGVSAISAIPLPENFGVATATLKFRKASSFHPAKAQA